MLKNGFLTKKSLSFIIHFSKKGNMAVEDNTNEANSRH